MGCSMNQKKDQSLLEMKNPYIQLCGNKLYINVSLPSTADSSTNQDYGIG